MYRQRGTVSGMEALPNESTEPMLKRGWHDFLELSRGHPAFNVLVGLLGALGSGVTELAPNDASTGARVLFAALTALCAFALSYLLTLAWSIARAPFRQRRELIAFADPDRLTHQPILITEPALETRSGRWASDERDRLGMPKLVEDQKLLALIRVFNAQEEGGEQASAKHVIPELSIFDGKECVFNWKGWDVLAWREFTTGHEEHALWIAAKWKGRSGFDIIRTSDAQAIKTLTDGSYRVELILRGYFPESPIRRDFTLTSHGPNADLELVATSEPDLPEEAYERHAHH